MSSSIFPDVNVWLALSVSGHVHHATAKAWFQKLERHDRLYFCRITQMGLLRLLSLEVVMGPGEALSQDAAWDVYERWTADPQVDFLQEPPGLDEPFRRWASANRPAPQAWSHDYLCAFAATAGLRLATLDRSLSRRVPGALLIA